MPNPNLEQLIAAAALLRPMLGDLVFVGGAVTSLLVTDEGAPLCRWVHTKAILDIMPLDEKILGFSDRWYAAAMESATTHQATVALRETLETFTRV
jgi:hypothetical protein